MAPTAFIASAATGTAGGCSSTGAPVCSAIAKNSSLRASFRNSPRTLEFTIRPTNSGYSSSSAARATLADPSSGFR